MTIPDLPANKTILHDELSKDILNLKKQIFFGPSKDPDFLNEVRALEKPIPKYDRTDFGIFRPDLENLVRKIQSCHLMQSAHPDFSPKHQAASWESYQHVINYWEQRFTWFLDESCSSHFQLI